MISQCKQTHNVDLLASNYNKNNKLYLLCSYKICSCVCTIGYLQENIELAMICILENK